MPYAQERVELLGRRLGELGSIYAAASALGAIAKPFAPFHAR
jgi:hypothetical protein